MPDEEKQRVAESTKAPEATAQEDAASLRAQIADLQKKAEDAIKEAKAHQSNFTKAQQELKRYQDVNAKIETLAAKMEVIGEALTVRGKRKVNEDVEETPQPEVDYKKRMAEVDTRVTQARLAELARQADREAYKGGFDIEKSPELEDARRLFQRGLPEDGLEEVRKVVTGKTGEPNKPAKTVDELTDEDRDEIARKYMEKKGLLKTDTGTPSGSLRDFAKVQQDYIEGKISIAEFGAERKKRGVS